MILDEHGFPLHMREVKEVHDIQGMLMKARSLPGCEYVGSWDSLQAEQCTPKPPQSFTLRVRELEGYTTFVLNWHGKPCAEEELMQQINRAMKESGLYGGENLTSTDFAYNARLAAARIREAAESFNTGTPAFRWAIMIAMSLDGYADALDKE